MRLYSLALIAAALALPSAAAEAQQDLAAGEQSFKKCLPCHSVGEGATNKVGPQLNGLEGKKAGTTPEYSYSEANKNSGLVWSEAVFKEYIKNPMGQMPGTKMAFPGIKNETEIGNLWAYLKQFGADGKIK
ncbi:MAG TPA: cytochrome c family protein [Xanthobacteraceae bacterium]|jgi:cytochrome c|nr:cytochrome c family protein [Xanthobacteraceae bacterium]